MSGTSAAAGYLQPISAPPADDDALANIFQGAVVGITGLDPTLVRPRWQPQPPTQPPVSVNWCAIGIVEQEAIDYPYEYHISAVPGSDDLQRHEKIKVLASFYGPNARYYAGVLRDGLYINQNLETLASFGIKMLTTDNMLSVPDLVNTQWISHVDLPLTFVRQIDRTYGILNIVSAEIDLKTDDGQTDVVNVP